MACIAFREWMDIWVAIQALNLGVTEGAKRTFAGIHYVTRSFWRTGPDRTGPAC